MHINLTTLRHITHEETFDEIISPVTRPNMCQKIIILAGVSSVYGSHLQDLISNQPFYNIAPEREENANNLLEDQVIRLMN